MTVTVALAFLLFLSVAVRVKVLLPAAVGLPVIFTCLPSAADRRMSAGSVPEVTSHV